MTIAMVVAGCAPAFTDMYIEALGDAGVQYGLQRATAYRLAAKMVEGVGALYMATGTHPGAMKDACLLARRHHDPAASPSCEKDGFRGAGHRRRRRHRRLTLQKGPSDGRHPVVFQSSSAV